MRKTLLDKTVGDNMEARTDDEEPMILEDILIEEFFVDGICGVY